jgi:hypothetical protein
MTQHLIDRIKARTHDDAGCAVWGGACVNRTHPAINTSTGIKLVRRLVWEAANGPIPAGKIIRCTCGTPRCVNAEHLELTTFKKLGKELGALGFMSGQKRSAKIASTKRKTHSKLTQEAVDAIRASSETTAVLGERYSITQAHVSKVRLHKVWRDFSSPWAGLGAA